MFRGNTESSISMSLENLDNIRPEGVVSKNDKGNRKTVNNNLLCIITAALQQPMTGNKSVNKEKKPTKEKKSCEKFYNAVIK